MYFSLRCLVADFMDLKREKRAYTRQIRDQFINLEREFVDFGELTQK